MKKYEGLSIRESQTHTGKIPHSIGFPGKDSTGGGVVRKLTKKEIESQAAFLR